MTVRVKQKTLNSNTTTPLITYPLLIHLHSTLCSSLLPLLLFPWLVFLITASGNFQKIGKKWAIIMHHKHVVLWFGTEIISPLKGQQRLCTWQWTKIKIHWQLIWPYSCLKEMEHMKYLWKRPFGISFILIFIARHFESWKKAKNLKFIMTH